jgi:hypothetical protein
MSDFCDGLLDYGGVKIMTNQKIGALMIVLGCLYFLMSLLIMYFIHRQIQNAKMGDDQAVQSVVFPVFVKIMWLNAIINIYIAFIVFCFDFDPYQVSGDEAGTWAFSLMYTLQHCIIEGVAILLMQKGLGKNAAMKTIKYISIWSAFSLFVHWGRLNPDRTLAMVMDLIWNILLLIFYLILWLAPLQRLYRRPAALFYAEFWALYRVVVITLTSMFYIRQTTHVAECFYTFGCLFPMAIFEPIILYYTFLQDSKWWQGLEISTNPKDPAIQDLRAPLLGVDLNVNSAQNLAASMDTMGVSAFRTVPKNVKLLNFAYITLDSSKMLGAGSFSRVYLGKYRQTPCAIKLIYTIDVTKEIIARITAEAEILSSLKNKNVVEILGVSVLPPSVCILLELCTYGSLNDVIGGTGFATLGSMDSNFMNHFLTGSETIGKFSKQKLNISWTDRLYLAIGCAKGIAAVHALRSDICHRDIKSFNFLVDEHLNAKISDLELGTNDNRDFMEKVFSKIHSTISAHHIPILMKKKDDHKIEDDLESPRPSDVRPSDLEFETFKPNQSNDNPDELHGTDFLANWAAPEVITDALHSQASDIYSFGLVLWEILSGTPPFSDVRKQEEIRDSVLKGIRPTIPDFFFNPPYDVHFAPYIELIHKCWKKEPLLRPSISYVLERLETIYRRQISDIASETEAVEPLLHENIENENRHSGLLIPGLPSPAKIKTYLHQHHPTLTAISSPLFGDKIVDPPTTNVTSLQMKQILSILQQENNILDQLMATQEAWCLCLPDEENTLIWGSLAFQDLFEIPLSDLLGKGLIHHPCFQIRKFEENQTILSKIITKLTPESSKNLNQLKEMKRKEKIKQFWNSLQEMKLNSIVHSIVSLLSTKTRMASNNSSRSSFRGHSFENHPPGTPSNSTTNITITTTSLFSLHSFPIPRKQQQHHQHQHQQHQLGNRNSASNSNQHSSAIHISALNPINIASSLVGITSSTTTGLANPNATIQQYRESSSSTIPDANENENNESHSAQHRDSTRDTLDRPTSFLAPKENNFSFASDSPLNYSPNHPIALIAIVFNRLKDD